MKLRVEALLRFLLPPVHSKIRIRPFTTHYSTYLKYTFSLSVKSINANLSLSPSSTAPICRRLFSLDSTKYNPTDAAIVMQ